MRTPHNRDDKIEGKQIGEDHREIEKTSAAILLAILKRILDSLDLGGKKARVEIDLDGKRAVEATQANTLNVKQMRDITPDDLRYIERAIASPAAHQSEPSTALDRDLTIRVNGSEVFRLKEGVVERNELQSERHKDVSVKPESKANPEAEKQIERAKQIAFEFAQQRQKGNSPNIEEVAKTVDSRQSSQPQAASESEAVQAVTPEVVPEKQTASISNAVNRKEPLQPTIVIFEREVSSRVQNRSVNNSLSGMFAAINQARLDIQRSVSSFIDRTRQKLGLGQDGEAKSLRQDLESLAVARTARKLIEQFGSPSPSGGRSFGGSTYQIHSRGTNLTVNATHRGTVLEVENGQIRSNLSERDVKQFREIDKQLMHDARQQLDRGEQDRDRDRGKSYEIE